MIEEQYVSIETAILAQRNWFNEPTNRIFRKDKTLDIIASKVDRDFLRSGEYLCPSQSLLSKWLRDIHRLHVCAAPFYSIGYTYYIFDISGKYGTCNKPGRLIRSSKSDYESYELAIEAGLQEALKLL